MTKERLEELMRFGATIYNPDGNEIQLINSKETRYYISDSGYLHICYLEKFEHHWDDRWLDIYIKINELYETKEQALWYKKTYAERTERFEPPMWENIKHYYCFNFVVNNCSRCFVVDKGHYITIDDDGAGYIFEEYASDVTKENYEKACEIVRDLFKSPAEL